MYLAITAERRSAVLASQYLWISCAVSYVAVTVGSASVVEIRITVAPVDSVSLPEAKHSSRTGRMDKTKQPQAPRNAPSHPNPRFFFPNHSRREVQVDVEKGGHILRQLARYGHLKARRVPLRRC